MMAELSRLAMYAEVAMVATARLIRTSSIATPWRAKGRARTERRWMARRLGRLLNRMVVVLVVESVIASANAITVLVSERFRGLLCWGSTCT